MLPVRSTRNQPARTFRRALLDDIPLDGSIAVMTIDVESHEAAVWRGAVRRLEQDRFIVFAEMLDVGQAQFWSITALFTRLDYLMFRLRPDCATGRMLFASTRSAEPRRHSP